VYASERRREEERINKYTLLAEIPLKKFKTAQAENKRKVIVVCCFEWG
jgi:hypothetical protein